MTPEMAARMRVFLEALCAALTGLFPKSRGLAKAFAAAFAWLDQLEIAAAPIAVGVGNSVVEGTAPMALARRTRASVARGGRRMRRVVAASTHVVGIRPGACPQQRATPGVAARTPRAVLLPSRSLRAKS